MLCTWMCASCVCGEASMQHQVSLFQQQLWSEKMGIWCYCVSWKLEVAWATSVV